MILKNLFEQAEKKLGDLTINGMNVSLMGKIRDKWDGDLNCNEKKITSLEGAPREVSGDFRCSYNKLTSLEGAPEKVGGNFRCNDNQLTSLEHTPKEVGGDFWCHENQLTSLEGAPEKVGGNFWCRGNHLTSLEGVHKIIKKMDGFIDADFNPIKSHVLGLLLIDGLEMVYLDNAQVKKILNKHLAKPYTPHRVYECQDELIEAGLEDFAQL